MSDITAHFYLSCVIVPNALFKSTYEIHSIFWRAFSDCHDTSQPFLFRAEPDAPETNRDATVFLVQSEHQPQWENVLELQVNGVKVLSIPLRTNDLFYFRLLASPVKTLSPTLNTETGKLQRGTKQIMRNRREIATWFEQKAKCGGFEPISYVFSIDQGRHYKQQSKNKQVFKLAACQFDGQLRVVEPNAFRHTLLNGIGQKKSFGFAMLSLAR